MIKKACQNCFKIFFVKSYYTKMKGRARFCSVKCRAKVVMGCYKYWEGKKRKITWTISKEGRERIRKCQMGSNNSMYGKDPWNKNKRCKKLAGKNNGCWKGENASYTAKHIWVKRCFGKANECKNKKCLGKSKNFDWANKSGKYKRIKSDWIMLCKSCHLLADRRNLWNR